jgi:hypothetical protein
MKFGSSQRQSLDGGKAKMGPGPGNYSDTFYNVVKSAPKYGFGTDSRQNSQDKLKKLIPGPGAYD